MICLQNGDTALILAAGDEISRSAIFERLLARGADPFIVNNVNSVYSLTEYINYSFRLDSQLRQI